MGRREMSSLHLTSVEDAPNTNFKIPALVAEGGSPPRLSPATVSKRNDSSPTSVTSIPKSKSIGRYASLATQISLTGQRFSGPPHIVTLKDEYKYEATPCVSSHSTIAFAPRRKFLGGYGLPYAETSLGRQKAPGPAPVIFSNPTSTSSTTFTPPGSGLAGSPRSPRSSRNFSPLFKKRIFIDHPYGTAAQVDNSYTTSPSVTSMSKSTAAGLKPSYSHTSYIPAHSPNLPNAAMSLKNECRPAIAARFVSTSSVTSSTLSCVAPTPEPEGMAACKPMFTRPSLTGQKVSYPPKCNVSTVPRDLPVPKPTLYVGITLEKPETLNSWGLVFTKDGRAQALIVRVTPPSKVDGPTVKWCQVTNSVPNPAAVYRTTKTPIVPLDKYEPSLIRQFPPPCEEKRLRDAGLLVPYINPGDAIIALNGIPLSAFPTMGNFATYIRQNCQRKMTIVAMRHENVWKAALEGMFAKPGGQEQQKEREGAGNNQTTKDHSAKAVKEAWRLVLFSRGGNHQVRHQATSHPPAKKRPKIYTPVYTYTNSLFRDGSGKPILYCDNNDFDPEDGKRIHGFVNDEIEKSFHTWLSKRKATWGEGRPRKVVLLENAAEDAIDEEPEESNVQREFWLASEYESFDQWLSASKSKWHRSYSWHKERRVALQSECEKEVHFPTVTTTIESQAFLNQLGDWLSARKQQWRLERRKRQRVSTEDEKSCLETGASSGDCAANDLNPSATNSTNQAMYFDEILEDEEERTTKEEESPSQPIDIWWVFDAQQGAPDDIIANIMTYLLPSDHGNLLCLSFGSNFLFKQRQDMWKSLCPKHWVLPRRPRKSWCVMYITKIRAEEEASRKRSDDLLVKANAIIEKGDGLNKIEKLVRKAEKDFEFSVNYISGVVLERNSLTNVAVIAKRHKIIKWLIEEKGADIETCDRGNFTPLMNAAWNGDKHIVRYLLGKGCDRAKVGYNHSSQGLAPATFKGLCAEGWARKRGHDEVADLIHFGL